MHLGVSKHPFSEQEDGLRCKLDQHRSGKDFDGYECKENIEHAGLGLQAKNPECIKNSYQKKKAYEVQYTIENLFIAVFPAEGHHE